MKNAVKFKGGISLSSSNGFKNRGGEAIIVGGERTSVEKRESGGVYITSRFPSRKEFIERNKNNKSRQSMSVNSPLNHSLTVKRTFDERHQHFLSPQGRDRQATEPPLLH